MTEKDFASPDRDQITVVEIEIGRVQRIIHFEIVALQHSKYQSYHLWPVCAGVTKAREQRGRIRAEQAESSATHSRPRTHSTLAENEHGSRDHLKTEHVTRATFDRDQPTSHGQSDLVAGITINEDRSPGHSFDRSAIGCSDKVAGVPFDMNQSTMHFGADPSVGVTVNDDFPTPHVTANVSPRGPVDVNLATGHVGSDPVDSGQVSLKVESLVAGIAGYGEHFRQGELAVAVEDLELLDLGQGFITGPVRSESLNLDGNSRFFTVDEMKGHKLLSPTVIRAESRRQSRFWMV